MRIHLGADRTWPDPPSHVERETFVPTETCAMASKCMFFWIPAKNMVGTRNDGFFKCALSNTR